MRRIGLLVALVLVVAGAAWWSGRSDGLVHVIVPPIAGDAALVVTGDRQTVLLDGGADGAATVGWLGRELPFWERRLDLVILTRADSMTLPGQRAVLRRYDAAVIAYMPPVKASAEFEAWRTLAAAHGGTVRVLVPGMRLHAGNVQIEVLTADAGRATLRLRYGKTVVYALHSATRSSLPLLREHATLRADMLLFPWQLQPDDALAAQLQPRAVIYTNGGNDGIEQTFYERWNGTIPLFHPATHGRLDWRSDGRAGTLRAERQP